MIAYDSCVMLSNLSPTVMHLENYVYITITCLQFPQESYMIIRWEECERLSNSVAGALIHLTFGAHIKLPESRLFTGGWQMSAHNSSYHHTIYSLISLTS